MKKILSGSLLVMVLCLPMPALAPAGQFGQNLAGNWILRLHLRPAIALRGQLAFTPVQDKDEECHPWQHKDENGNCVDNSNVTHHHGHYEPQPGETCWVECLCEEGQSPSDSSCSPCSYVGMVCTQ